MKKNSTQVPTPIRVFIIDDHQLVRAGLRTILESAPDMQVVGEAASSEQALRNALAADPQVIIVDISLPGVSGIEAIGRLRRALPSARILVVSMHNAETFFRLALKRGASGYISKQSAPAELLTAVRATFAGQPYLDPHIVEKMVWPSRDPRGEQISRLAPREFEVFLLLAKGYSVKKIAETLHVGKKMIYANRAQMMQKLGCKTVGDIVQYAAKLELVDPFCASDSEGQASQELDSP